MNRIATVSALAIAALLAVDLAAAHAQGAVVPKRQGFDYNRAARVPRASDPLWMKRAPTRVAPRVKSVPKAKPGPRPRYGDPEAPIERIPRT